MKSDIDALMAAKGLDALLITGPAQHNPAMYYFTGRVHVTQGLLIKKRGQEPVLFHPAMERDEAAATGLQTRSIADYPLTSRLEQTGGDLGQATALQFLQILADLGLSSGRIGVYGKADISAAYAIFSALQRLAPELEIVGEAGGFSHSLLLEAMATKEPAEVERIRRIGAITVEVMGLTADWLTGQAVQDEILVKPDGAPLCVGDIKRQIDLWLAERGAENPEGTIFAIGREAGVPHSTGSPQSPLRLGQTVVFDIFPREAGGGYFYDITRTWCLGYAPDEALALYETVLSVYRQLVDELQFGMPARSYQLRACELFRQHGHPTVQEDPKTTDGYVHGLGHGVGLNLHEHPLMLAHTSPDQRIGPGNVLTIEPGLYYPERGLGVRLEDTLWLRPDGVKEVLADFPMDLVLPMKKTRVRRSQPARARRQRIE